MKEIKKLVKRVGNGAHVTLPLTWLGKFVKISLDEDDKRNNILEYEHLRKSNKNQ